MTARRDQRAGEDVQLRLELEEEKRAEEDYEEMLRQEAERMSVRDFQPKVCIIDSVDPLLSSLFHP